MAWALAQGACGARPSALSSSFHPRWAWPGQHPLQRPSGPWFCTRKGRLAGDDSPQAGTQLLVWGLQVTACRGGGSQSALSGAFWRLWTEGLREAVAGGGRAGPVTHCFLWLFPVGLLSQRHFPTPNTQWAPPLRFCATQRDPDRGQNHLRVLEGLVPQSHPRMPWEMDAAMGSPIGAFPCSLSCLAAGSSGF